MCVLMLRGAQTLGRVAWQRFAPSRVFQLEEVEQTLNGLISRETEPLVVRLPRQPGQKEGRFAHLLSGEIDIEALAARKASVFPRLDARTWNDWNKKSMRSLRKSKS